MRRICFIGGLVLFGIGCDQSSAPPPTLLPDSTLVNVLVELRLLDARETLSGQPEPALRDSVLTRYGVDSTRFATTLRYYADHPEAYLALYEQVIETLGSEY